MRKAQELSLNLIVVGALALLVLLIIGGILIFGGGDLLGGLTGIGASDEEVRITQFLSSCQSRCNTLNLLVDFNDLDGANTDEGTRNQIKSYCCESSDLDQDGTKEGVEGDFGAEICALAYDCNLDGQTPSTFCDTSLGLTYDFTAIGDINDPTVCGLN